MNEYKLKNGGVLKFVDGKPYIEDIRLDSRFQNPKIMHPAIFDFRISAKHLISSIYIENKRYPTVYFDLINDFEEISKILKFIADNLGEKKWRKKLKHALNLSL